MKKEKKNLSLVYIEHVWSVLCASSSIDQTTKNVSLFNILEQLNLNKDQVEAQKKSDEKLLVPFPFHLVSLWRKVGKGNFGGSMKMEIVDPNDETLGTGESALKFEDSKDRFRATFALPAMPITVPGYYSFRVFLKQEGGQYEKITEIPLQVVFN
jgi:hypothetical protein